MVLIYLQEVFVRIRSSLAFMMTRFQRIDFVNARSTKMFGLTDDLFRSVKKTSQHHKSMLFNYDHCMTNRLEMVFHFQVKQEFFFWLNISFFFRLLRLTSSWSSQTIGRRLLCSHYQWRTPSEKEHLSSKKFSSFRKRFYRIIETESFYRYLACMPSIMKIYK